MNKIITVKELAYQLEKVNSCHCRTCLRNKELFLEWYAFKQNQMIESILLSVRTILEVKDFRHTKMTVGDLKKL